MPKKMLLVSLIFLFVVGFAITDATAADPNWKEKQQKFYEMSGLKPGDVIDKSNWQKIKDYVPPHTLEWFKKGEFIATIGEFKYDFDSEEGWDKATAANKGKYGLGQNKEVIDNATGQYPMWLFGDPYPDLDLKGDPDAGIKVMHNKKAEESRTPKFDLLAETIWIGENGYERDFHFRWRRFYFWSRPEGEIPNPTHTKSYELTHLLQPYELTGTVILTDSPLDGTGDRQYLYVPSIRRIKKQSGANRSDPSFGSDFVSDDGAGWMGQAETMKWEVLGTQVVLVCLEKWLTEHPDICDEQPDGSWKTRRDIPQSKFKWNDPKAPSGIAQWCPTGAVWVPREVIVMKGTPLDPYYNYGHSFYYVDKQNQATCYYKINHNKAGEYWKTVMVNTTCQLWGEGYKTFSAMAWHFVLDEKTHHASINMSRGQIVHAYSDLNINGEDVQLEMFRPEYIPTMSK